MNLELLVNEHNSCGENPLWDDERKLLFWCDIPPGKIWEFNPQTHSHRLVTELNQECGAFSLQQNGDLLLLLTGEAALLNVESGKVRHLKNSVVTNTERFNDCIADVNGRVFAGTVDWSQRVRGGLFRLDFNLDAQQITTGSDCSNGLGWTPDGRGLFWADSTAKTVFRFDYEPQTSELSNQTRWLETPGLTPDGLTTDFSGGVWIAFFDGPFLRHYDQNARLIEQIDLPAKNITSCIFGGENLNELYVTTAGGNANSAADDLSGALFRIQTSVRGMREHRSKISE